MSALPAKLQEDPLQRERAILRAFRQSTNLRAKTEAEASSFRQVGRKEVDAKLAETRKAVPTKVNEAREAVKDAEVALSGVRLRRAIDELRANLTLRSKPIRLAVSDLDSALARSASVAVKVAKDIASDVEPLLDWQRPKDWQITKGYYRWLSKREKTEWGCLFSVLFIPVFALFAVTAFIDTIDFATSRLYKLLNKSYERDLVQQIERHIPGLLQASAETEAYCDGLLDQAEKEHDHSLKEIEADYQRRMAETQSVYERSWQQVLEGSSALCRAVGLIGAGWGDPLWSSWVPLTEGNVSPYLRIGQLVDQGQWHHGALPALLPVIGKGNVVIKCFGAAKDQAVQIVRSLMLRMLATVPPGKLRFTLMDPVGLGQSMAAFMSLADYDEALVGGKIWTEPQHIEEQLARLTEHMEFVIQKFLRDKYPTIEDYNTEAGEVAEPYRALVVINFPVNFSESAARRLVSIALNGPRCGVYTIITIDTEQQPPYGFREAVEKPRSKQARDLSRKRGRREDEYPDDEEED